MNNNLLVFSETTAVELCTNKFLNVPIILQYEDIPLLEVVKIQQAGFTTKIPIYHPDGTYLAKAVGSRLVLTKDGDNAGLSLEYSDRMTVCKLGKQTLFEITRTEAAALKTQAELYTPDGAFVRCPGDQILSLFKNNQALKLGGLLLSNNTFSGCRIGIHIRADGGMAIGCN